MRLIFQLIRMLFQMRRLESQHRRSMADLKGMTDRQSAVQGWMDAYKNGDYEGALRFADTFKSMGDARDQYTFYRGSILTCTGQFAESEVLLRENISARTDTERLRLSHSTLGLALLYQKKYDEAQECFETALRMKPGRGSIHREMAEVALSRGSNPADILPIAKLAVEECRAEERTKIYPMNLSESLATCAWAVAAATRDAAEVEGLLAEAIPMIEATNVKPLVGQVHFHAGQAYSALQDTGKANQHYDAALAADPNGLWGRAVQAMATR